MREIAVKEELASQIVLAMYLYKQCRSVYE